jgi:hypothetical protein
LFAVVLEAVLVVVAAVVVADTVVESTLKVAVKVENNTWALLPSLSNASIL